MKFAKYFFATVVLCAGHSFATTHVITFQNFSYSPSTLQVSVGDTIQWVGEFTMHPLQDSVLPDGAAPFGPIASGSTFTYPVTTAGTYWYHCNSHFFFGMHGTFTAIPVSDVKEAENNILDAGNFPNPFKTNTKIHFTLTSPAEVNLTFFDLSGKQVHHIDTAFQNAGVHEILFDAGSLPSGAYYYKLQVGEALVTRMMVLAR